MVVRGDRDTVLCPEWARTVADLLSAGQLVTLPDAPHGLPYSAPDALVGVVHWFLNAGCSTDLISAVSARARTATTAIPNPLADA